MKDHETKTETLKLLADSLRNGLTLIDELLKEPEEEPIPFTEPEEVPEVPVLPKRLTPLKPEHMIKGTIKSKPAPTPADIITMLAEAFEPDDDGTCLQPLRDVYSEVRKACIKQGKGVPTQTGIRYCLHMHSVPIEQRWYHGMGMRVCDLSDLYF